MPETDEGIACIFAGQDRREHEARRRLGRHVLHGVNCKVDAAREQGILDFPGEKTLAADVGKRPVLDAVPGRRDGDDLDLVGAKSVGFFQSPLDFPRLREGKGRATGTKSNSVHLRNLSWRCYRPFRP